MKKMKKSLLLLCLAIFTLIFIQNSTVANDLEMVAGWKAKSIKNKDIKLSADLNTEEGGGSLTFGLKNETSLTHYCKNRKNRECPKAYFNVK